VSLTVVFRETALRNLARIRSEDKDLFVRTRRTVALLADQPYPEGAVAWGATGCSRMVSHRERLPPTGNRMYAPCCDVFELVDGKIKRFDCYPKARSSLPSSA
jgi:hypothetical protein